MEQNVLLKVFKIMQSFELIFFFQRTVAIDFGRQGKINVDRKNLPVIIGIYLRVLGPSRQPLRFDLALEIPSALWRHRRSVERVFSLVEQ